MSVGIGKTSNMYAAELYDLDAPKTVFMAIALSFAMRLDRIALPFAVKDVVAA